MRFYNKTFSSFLVSIWFGMFFLTSAWGQVITTVAGNGSGFYPGDGGLATLAGLGCPEDIAIDSKGNFYIADGCNFAIRKVDSAGTITTVVGSTTSSASGYTGDGGPATLATLNYPAGLAFDSQNNLFIADYYNNVVRKVSSASGTLTGACTISTVVGVYPGNAYTGDNGPATLAQLFNPQNIKFDTLGNLFFSDVENHVIRKVNTGTGIITTVAGSGVVGSAGDGGPATLASFQTPEGMFFNALGDLYVADDGAFVVRKIASTAGTITGSCTITTVAGNGTQGFSGDNGPATLATLSGEVDGVVVGCGGNIYLADGLNHRIREIYGAPETITTVIGTGTPGYSNNVAPLSAQINHPEALAFNPSTGDLYVVNYASSTVQKVVAYCTLTPVPTPSPTPAPTAVGCGKPIETFCFPNPAVGTSATILCNLCESSQVSIRVYNTAAELVETYSFQGNSGANYHPINIGGLSHGIYYYVVQAQGSMGPYKSDTSKFAVVR